MAQGKATLVALAVWAGCGGRPNTPPPDPVEKKDAGVPDAPVADVADRPLGLPTLAAYGWRKRAGQASFRLARKAEDRGDWAGVVAACRQVLGADPGHLEASWLLAVGLAKLGQLDQVLAPLHEAAAGDFAKWGPASLELPALQGFLATPIGEAWRRRVEQDRARYGAAVARAVMVIADGDLYGYDVETARWYRLSRPPGAVLGGLAVQVARQVAYVTRARGGRHELAIGIIDLARARTSRPVALGTSGPIAVAYSEKPPAGFWIGNTGARTAAWRQLDADFHLHALPPRTARPPGAWLEVGARGAARLHALPVNVVADWDDQSLASAVRIGTSNRVVSVPSPGLIDGNTAAWSPDRAQFAFVAQLDDHCAAGAVNTAAYVADASTGGMRELERAAGGIALQWLAERTVVIAGDAGVVIRSLDEGVAPIDLAGADGLLIPRERPRCAPREPADDVGEDEPAEPAVEEAPMAQEPR